MKSLLSLAALALATSGAFAQAYPVKPITLIVPFAAGGPSDAHMRQWASAMQRQLKQPLIVENVGGGGGNIGPARAAKAAPDGYTLLNVNIGIATAPALYRSLDYNPVADFDYLGTLVFDPSLMMARKDFPGATFKETIEYIRANPGKVSIGASGPSLLSALLFMEKTGTKLTVINYKGGGPAMTDLVGGHIDLLSNSASIVGPLIRGGKVRALGVGGLKRVTNLPEVPTLDEQGLTGYEVMVWTSVLAPKGLPKPVHDRLASALWATLSDQELVAHFLRNGGVIADRHEASPAGLEARVKAEVEKWGGILRRAGVKPE
jgi:tripartite-type tricarboxylate transporter receptor subunit TctC